MSKPKRPNLEDVARRAGVSTATVSRALNTPEKLAPETQRAVERAVAELRYTPNFGARAIAAGRTGIIGAIVPTLENSIFARGIEAFQRELANARKTMFVGSSDYDPGQERKLVEAMVGRGAEGLLLIGTERPPETYLYLRERGVAFVLAWAISSDPDLNFVGFDNFAAAHDLAGKALSMGHRRFGYISAKLAGNDRAAARLAGTRAALSSAGIGPEGLIHVEAEYSIHSGRTSLARILEAERAPSVVLCGNDVLAAGAVLEAHARGLRVPQDLSVLGFDDIDLAQAITPPLSTLRVPHSAMGMQAAKAIVALIDEPGASFAEVLGVELVMRDTLGHPSETL